MSHTISIGGLLSTIGVFVGIALAAIGALAFFAGSMSDAPAAGESAGKFGCSLFIAGVLILAFCVWSLVA